jgi:hypothetical protein
MYTRMRGSNHHWFTPHSEAVYDDLLAGLETWFERSIAPALATEPRHIRQSIREDCIVTVQAALKLIYLRGIADGMDREEPPILDPHSEPPAPGGSKP